MQLLATDADRGQTLAALVRDRMELPWSKAKKLVSTGKVFVDGDRVTDPGHRLRGDESIEVRHAAPRPRDRAREVQILFEDAHVVLIDKPSGISSVPYERGERGTALDLIRDAWRRKGLRATDVPLHVVHRIDKDTSGVMVFAKSKRAELDLARQFREHTIERVYHCIAHGQVRAARIESKLVRDRGDGLRGSARPGQRGKRAVTHVEPIVDLPGATLCRVQLETGKTHQIRIHLSERGHPLVGERVYIRDFVAAGNEPIPSPRLMLYAATLAFAHPITGAPVQARSRGSEPAEITEELTKNFRAASAARKPD